MPKFKYVGEESPINLAQIGKIKTGDVFFASPEIAAGLDVHGAGEFERVSDDVKVTAPASEAGITLAEANQKLADAAALDEAEKAKKKPAGQLIKSKAGAAADKEKEKPAGADGAPPTPPTPAV